MKGISDDLWHPPISATPKPLSCWVSKSVSQTKRSSSCLDLSQLNVSCVPESSRCMLTPSLVNATTSTTVSSTCIRNNSKSSTITAQRNSTDALPITSKRLNLQRIKSDYVCRLPLYLKNGMARVRILLTGTVRLSAKELVLVISGHRVLSGLTIDIAHTSSGGLCQVLSSSNNDFSSQTEKMSPPAAGSKPGNHPLENRAANFPEAFRQSAFSPEKSNIFCLTAIISLPEKTIDLAATQAIVDWEAARSRYISSDSPAASPQRNLVLTRNIIKQYPAVLGQLSPLNWSGRLVRPCYLPDKDSGVFAVVKCDSSTGNNPVDAKLVSEMQQRLNADNTGSKMLAGNSYLSICDYSAITYPKINRLLDRIDPRLPLAVCCRLTRHKNAAQVTAGLKTNVSISSSTGNRTFSYLADTCAVYPLSAWQWFLLSLLPTVLHQLTRALLSLEFTQLLINQLDLRGQLESTVLIPDRVDAPVCALSELFEKTNADIHVQNETSLDDLELDRQATGPPDMPSGPKLPQPSSLLEAITLLSAKDAVNLERLEWLGDSLLQLIGSLTVYTTLPPAVDEGTLTKYRVSMVCNFNLSRLAVNHGWGKYCMGRMFLPTDHYLPPCFTVSHPTIATEGDQRLYVELTDKSLADMVEALIGYFLTSTDLPTACALLSYLGLSTVKTKAIQVPGTPSWSQLFSCEAVGDDGLGYFSLAERRKLRPRLSLNTEPLPSSSLLPHLWKSFELSPFEAARQVDKITKHGMQQLEATLTGLQVILGYRFNETRHLVEALSPPPSPCSSLFGSYQRLEFLGDAVLGNVVSMYLYEKCPGWKPGELTEARSNLVKNDTLALSVVEQKIYHFILCNPETIQLAVSTIQTIQDKESSYSKQLELLCAKVLSGLKVKVIADIFEAIIGAIFVDTNGSLSTATRVVCRLLDKRLDSYLREPPVNILQKLHLLHPDLKYDESCSEAGNKYTLKASLNGKEIITSGVSRNEARLALARRLDVLECLRFST